VFDALLAIEIINGPLIAVFYIISIAAALYLLLRRPTAIWIATALVGILAGAVIGAATVFIVNAMGTFGEPLPSQAAIWVIVTFAAIALAIVNLWRSRWWRKVIAAVSIIIFALTGTLAINAYYGLNHTVGSMFGVVTGKAIDGGVGPVNTSTADPTKPLWQTWKPPADMPKTGKTGLLTGKDAIPNTLSGFKARDASLYLPPAAQVKNAPRLPFVLLMMGQPGTPDPQYIAAVLDTYAAQHEGLAPIVVVADQLGNPSVDPVCADSTKYGKVHTYLTQDVVNWAKTNLNILREPKYWTIAGYSNGGACAFQLAAQSPDVWGNLLDISGDEFPGVETQDATIRDIFGGNKAAFEASKPTSMLAAHKGGYTDSDAIFTVGQNDPGFIPGADRNAKAAQAAGMTTTYYVVPGAGHVVDALNGGLTKGFEVLYPRLGLSKPN
jgi:enterochelin esterase-like enzyme